MSVSVTVKSISGNRLDKIKHNNNSSYQPKTNKRSQAGFGLKSIIFTKNAFQEKSDSDNYLEDDEKMVIKMQNPLR